MHFCIMKPLNMAKPAVFQLLDSLKLISHNIWVTGQFGNFQTMRRVCDLRIFTIPLCRLLVASTTFPSFAQATSFFNRRRKKRTVVAAASFLVRPQPRRKSVRQLAFENSFEVLLSCCLTEPQQNYGLSLAFFYLAIV